MANISSQPSQRDTLKGIVFTDMTLLQTLAFERIQALNKEALARLPNKFSSNDSDFIVSQHNVKKINELLSEQQNWLDALELENKEQQ